MKKRFILFTATLMLLNVSCSNSKGDEPKEPEKPKILKIDPDNFTIDADADGGEFAFKVIAENTVWAYDSKNTWIKISVDSDDANKVIIDVEPNPENIKRDGSLEISAEGCENIVIPVTQKGQELLVFKNTSRQLMNLKGDVKKVSYLRHVRDDKVMRDVMFNNAGMITSFITNSRSKDVNVDITYYDDNRMKQFTVVSAPNNYDYDIIFEYGNHGKYITTDELRVSLAAWNLPQDKQNLPFYACFPQLIKNLTKITVVDRVVAKDGFEIKFEMKEGGKMIGYMNATGDAPDEYFDYTFEGDYIKTVTYGSGWFATDCSYTLNKETGCVLENSQFNGVLKLKFNDDRINSYAGFTNTEENTSEEYKYNEKLDYISFSSDGTVVNTVSYEYDEKGNWVKMTVSGKEPITRQITY